MPAECHELDFRTLLHYSSAKKRRRIDSVMKKSNRNSLDPEDDTDLEIDAIEDAVHLETEIVESVGNPGLRSRFSCDPEDDTDLEIDGIEDKVNLEIDSIEDKVNLELKSVDLLIGQGPLNQIDIVLEQGAQNQIDIVHNGVMSEQAERLQAIYLAQQEQIKDLELGNRRLVTEKDSLEKNIHDLESILNVYPLMNVELPDDIVLIPEDFNPY
jgi:hypothetical protein